MYMYMCYVDVCGSTYCGVAPPYLDTVTYAIMYTCSRTDQTVVVLYYHSGLATCQTKICESCWPQCYVIKFWRFGRSVKQN